VNEPKSYRELARFCEDSVTDSQRKFRKFGVQWPVYSIIYSAFSVVTDYPWSFIYIGLSVLQLLALFGMRQFLQRRIQKMLTYRQEALDAAKEEQQP